MAESNALKLAKKQIEKVFNDIHAQFIRVIKEPHIHYQTYLGGDMIWVGIAVKDTNDKQKERLEKFRTPDAYKKEIWIKQPHQSSFKRLRLFDGKWEELFPIQIDSAPTPKKPSVYFILNPTKNIVKIGMSNNASRRMAELKSHNLDPLRVIKIIDADQPDRTEKDLHQRFCHLRYRGEWFFYKDEIVNYLTQGEQ